MEPCNPFRPRDPRMAQRGSSLVYGVFWCFILMLSLGAVLDLGGAFATAIHDNSMMQVTREETQSTGNGFLVKNSSDPTAALAKQVATSLRNQGFDGAMTIDVWEPMKGATRAGGTLPDDRRVIVYEIKLSDESNTWALKGLGIDTLPIETSGTWYLTLYSNSTIYRATDSKVYRRYTLAAGKQPTDPGAFTYKSLANSKMSDAMKAEADRAMSQFANK